MMRVGDKLVHQIGAYAIVNGENLGQVASQTLHSMYAINNVIFYPSHTSFINYTIKKKLLLNRKKLATWLKHLSNLMMIVAKFSIPKIQ